MIAETAPSNNTDKLPPAPVLSSKHEHELERESSIARPVIRARGYSTVSRDEVPPEFKGYQRRAGLLIPTYAIDGRTSYRIKGNTPRVRKDGTLARYDHPTGTELFVDVHPMMHDAARDPSRPIWFIEGEKKCDAMASRGEVAGCLFGVHAFGVPGTRGTVLRPDFDHFALRGRKVIVGFDADVMLKENVQLALTRFTKLLQARGADVWVLYLPIDGPKGIDDFLAAGGTVAELRMLCRRFEPSDFARVRLSRDDKLRAAIRELQARHDAMPATRRTDGTDRAIMRALIGKGAASGKLVRGGLRVQVDRRTLAELAAVSLPSVTRAIPRLEADGYLRRDVANREPEAAGAFILNLAPRVEGARSRTHQGSTGETGEPLTTEGAQGKPLTYQGYDPGVYASARGTHEAARPVETVPELRWGYVRAVREIDDKTGAVFLSYEYVDRPGKKRGDVLAYLVDHDGTATVDELADRFAGAKTRPRDFKRRTLDKLVENGIVEIDGERVTLYQDWREALEDWRKWGEEIDAGDIKGAATLQRERHERQRAGWRHARQNGAPDPVPATPPIDDMRRHWAHHPEGCACRECTKRFGRVIGEHVEGCACASCFSRRLRRGDRSLTPAPEQGTVTRSPERTPAPPEQTSPPSTVPKQEPPAPKLEHVEDGDEIIEVEV